jgi:hypothetical protein
LPALVLAREAQSLSAVVVAVVVVVLLVVVVLPLVVLLLLPLNPILRWAAVVPAAAVGPRRWCLMPLGLQTSLPVPCGVTSWWSCSCAWGTVGLL